MELLNCGKIVMFEVYSVILHLFIGATFCFRYVMYPVVLMLGLDSKVLYASSKWSESINDLLSSLQEVKSMTVNL
jgi:hypothetical protein